MEGVTLWATHFRGGWRTTGLRTNLRLHRKGGGRM